MTMITSQYKHIKYLIILCLLVASQVLSAAPNTKHSRKMKRKYKKNEILVTFKKNVNYATKTSVVKKNRDLKLRDFGHSKLVHIRIKDKTIEQAIREYQKDPNVAAAQPNYIYYKSAVPNDPDYNQAWGLKNNGQVIERSSYETNNPGTAGADINIEKVWDHITDASGIIIAVVDTGVNYDHQDLNGNMWKDGNGYHGYDFVDNDNDPMDYNGHGSHVAGTIAGVGNNKIGATGVCWKAKIMAVRVLDAMGAGTTADIVAGINWAVANGAKVVNMSLGGSFTNDGSTTDTALANAISDAEKQDVLMVVAAGNDNDDVDDLNDGATTYPCRFDNNNVLCVAAVDQAFELADFSNTGKTSVDIAAPGTNILSTVAGNTVSNRVDFNTGGNLDWTKSSNNPYGSQLEWAYQQLWGLDMLTYPAVYDGESIYDVTGVESFSEYTYKNLGNISENSDVAILEFYADYLVPYWDDLNIYAHNNANNPYLYGTELDAISNVTTDYYFYYHGYDISNIVCGEPACNIGFRYRKSANSDILYGVGIAELQVSALSLNTSSYSVYDGTSMATPHVTGVAAMIYAYNPDYKYNDVLQAIKTGGREAAALSSVTVTGKTVDAIGALSHISAPVGVSAEVDYSTVKNQ